LFDIKRSGRVQRSSRLEMKELKRLNFIIKNKKKALFRARLQRANVESEGFELFEWGYWFNCCKIN